MLRHPQEAEVIGRVVGIALKLGEWRPVDAFAGFESQNRKSVQH